MKKAVSAIIGLWLLSTLPLAAEFRFGLKGSFFSSENQTFRDVYGNGAKIGLEAGLGIADRLSLFAGLDYLHKTGGLTLTKEEARVTLVPISVGLRYDFPAGEKLLFHLGLGVQEVFFREESMLGTTSENALGFMAAAGAIFRITERIGAGVFAAWSTCKMTHDAVGFKVGGLDIGGTIEVRF
jgi:opacity protein-like surface antigen